MVRFLPLRQLTNQPSAIAMSNTLADPIATPAGALGVSPDEALVAELVAPVGEGTEV